MVSKRRDESRERPRRPPATTPEARENQLIAAAVDFAERSIRNGTASSQIVTHYLKLGSSREKLEQEGLRRENELRAMKAEAMASAKRIEELYANAIDAMRGYQGLEAINEDDLGYDD